MHKERVAVHALPRHERVQRPRQLDVKAGVRQRDAAVGECVVGEVDVERRALRAQRHQVRLGRVVAVVGKRIVAQRQRRAEVGGRDGVELQRQRRGAEARVAHLHRHIIGQRGLRLEAQRRRADALGAQVGHAHVHAVPRKAGARARHRHRCGERGRGDKRVVDEQRVGRAVVVDAEKGFVGSVAAHRR